jgi:uncharacterized protein YndB with AHSA1/START domain
MHKLLEEIAERELVTTCILNFPVNQVFAAWRDPSKLAKWWGPHGFTNTFDEFDFKENGKWTFVMHGPNGRDYFNKIIFKDIIPGKKITFDHILEPHFKTQVTFDDLGDRTKISYRQLFDSKAKCEAVKSYAIDGNEQNMDRLNSLLLERDKPYIPNPDLDLVLEREVDLPPHILWQAWTNPLHLKQWFCPRPWTIKDCTLDLRPQGSFNVVMCSPEGKDFPMEGTYLELVENRKIIWTDTLTQSYRPSKEPFMTAIVTFEPFWTGTKYRAVAIHKSVEDRKKHEEMGFYKGWSTCVDQLVEYMKNLKIKG